MNELRDELHRLESQYEKVHLDMKRRLDDKEGKAREMTAISANYARE